MAKRVTGECVSGEQRGIRSQNQRAHRNAELSSRPQRAPHVVPEKKQNDQCEVQQIAMQVLQDQWKCSLAAILASRSFSDSAAWRMECERTVVRLAVVVTGQTKSSGRPENEHRRGEPLRQRRPVTEVRREEGGEELSNLVVAIHQRAQRGVDESRL